MEYARLNLIKLTFNLIKLTFTSNFLFNRVLKGLKCAAIQSWITELPHTAQCVSLQG